MGMGLNHTVYPLISCNLVCKIVISPEEKNRKMIFPPFGNGLLLSSKNIILKGNPIIYP